jgi:hypothetical protein
MEVVEFFIVIALVLLAITTSAIGVLRAARTHAGAPVSGVERIAVALGGLACGLLGLFWAYLGVLPGLCETDCASQSAYSAVFHVAEALASVTVGLAALLLIASAITGRRALTRIAMWFVLAGVVGFIAWFGSLPVVL